LLQSLPLRSLYMNVFDRNRSGMIELYIMGVSDFDKEENRDDVKFNVDFGSDHEGKLSTTLSLVLKMNGDPSNDDIRNDNQSLQVANCSLKSFRKSNRVVLSISIRN